MTRYARGKGAKGCNNKHENTATSWHLLKAKSCDRNVEHGDKVSKQSQDSLLLPETGNNDLWFDFCANRKNVICGEVKKIRPVVASHSRNDNRGKIFVNSKEENGNACRMPEKEIGGSGRKKASVKKNSVFGNETSCGGNSISKMKKKRASTLDTLKNNAGRKFKANLSEEDLKEKRRKEKALKREKKKLCFCCRRWGHQLADCPEFTPIGSLDVSSPPGGLCYHCGSTEHNVNQCNKPRANSFKFARCFVCGEDGHLARQCQDNPKGKYPKGGACRLCGKTSHLCSECPTSINTTTESMDTLSWENEGPVDSIPEDKGKSCHPSVGPKKIIQF